MKLIKRISLLIFTLLLCVSLCGCMANSNTVTKENNVYENAVAEGYTGTLDEWLLSLIKESSYKSVYDLAVDEGLFTGTLSEFIESLKGSEGKNDVVDSASKSLTSTVSIFCNFTVTTTSSRGWPFGGGGTTTSQAKSAGSGVIYKTLDDGTAYIVTNYHVIYYKNADSKISNDIYIYLYGMEYSGMEIKADYLGGSMEYDIAVLKVQSDYLKNNGTYPYHQVTIGDSSTLEVGESVIAVGNPESDGLSVTNGVVSVESENITMYLANETTTTSRRVIRIDAAVNSGNSGGGLYNQDGLLIGIVNAKTVDEEVEGMCYAIPINIASAISDKVISTCDGINTTTISRVYLGINTGIASSVAHYDEETGRLSIVQQIGVSSVSLTGDSYGILKENDIFVSAVYNNKTYIINTNYALEDLLLKINKGDSIELNIIRGGVQQTVSVVFNSDKVLI